MTQLAETRIADKTAGAVFTNVLGAAKAALRAEANRLTDYYLPSPQETSEQYQTPEECPTCKAARSGILILLAVGLVFVLSRR